jgi:uncharacterized membrane protein
MDALMADINLNPTDRAVLDMLREGRCSPAYIAEETGYSSGNISNRLSRLAEHGYTNMVHPGLWELIEDPRD